MAEELKPKSFRITDDTADKFKEIAANIGGNQQETLAKLIEAFEFQAGKAILTDKKDDIEQFEKYVSIITSMFMRSLEDNQNLSATIRTEFESMLASKDSTIEDLQGQLKVAKDLKDAATATAKEKTEEATVLAENVEYWKKELNDKTTNYENIIEDKESLIVALKDAGNELKAKNEAMLTEHQTFGKMKEKLEANIEKQHDLEAQVKETAKEIANMQKQHTAELKNIEEKSQIEQDRAILKLKEEFQAKLQAEKEKQQAEIDKYQEKYLTLLNQLEEKKEL